MAQQLYWDDAEDLGFALAGKFPAVNPLDVRFTDLHRWIIELSQFADQAEASTEGKLERIQMAWYDEWKDKHR